MTKKETTYSVITTKEEMYLLLRQKRKLLHFQVTEISKSTGKK